MKQLYTGVAIKNISKTNIEGIKIPVPSFERQKEIVDYCDYNDKLIKQLEKEIENNKKQAQQFIATIVKIQVQSVQEEQDDINLVSTEDEEEKLFVPVEENVVTVEEELVIESKPKVKKIVKKTEKKIIKKSLVVEEDS
jgi:restriction endonuclease S subunit